MLGLHIGFFRWLYRLPGRFDRSMEKTALASSVIQSEGIGQLNIDPGAMNAALGEMEARGSREADSADAECG
ncbi:MAG: hypothetical protein ACJ75L_05850 [Gaiellaceae bacterium]